MQLDECLFNFENFYNDIKELLINSILQKYAEEDREIVKSRALNTYICFHDSIDNKLKYLDKMAMNYEDVLCRKFFDKFNIKYNDNNYNEKKKKIFIYGLTASIPISYIISISKDDQPCEMVPLIANIVKEFLIEIGISVTSDSSLEKIIRDKDLVKYVIEIDNYRQSLLDELIKYKNEIKRKYSTIYEELDTNNSNALDISSKLSLKFNKFLMDNNFLIDSDKEKIKNGASNEELDFYKNRLFTDSSFLIGAIDYLDADISSYNREYEKNTRLIKDYFKEARVDVTHENIKKIIDFRETLRDEYLLKVVAKEESNQKMLDGFFNYLVDKNYITQEARNKDEDMNKLIVYFSKYCICQDNIKLLNIDESNKVISGRINGMRYRILKVSPISTYINYYGIIRVLIHEIIHTLDINNSTKLGVFNECCVEIFAMKIWQELFPILKKKYPEYSSIYEAQENTFYYELFPLCYEFINDNLEFIIHCKANDKIDSLYEKFGSNNFNQFIDLLNYSFDLIRRNNTRYKDLSNKDIIFDNAQALISKMNEFMLNDMQYK